MMPGFLCHFQGEGIFWLYVPQGSTDSSWLAVPRGSTRYSMEMAGPVSEAYKLLLCRDYRRCWQLGADFSHRMSSLTTLEKLDMRKRVQKISWWFWGV